MAATSVPTRWIACVDGTWCTPDGTYGMLTIPSRDNTKASLILYFIGNTHNNISNIYRICASVKVGECVDGSSGFTYSQVR